MKTHAKRQSGTQVFDTAPENGGVSCFEFVRLSVDLCRLYGKDPSSSPPERYFDQAFNLLVKAGEYLSPERLRAEEQALSDFVVRFLDDPHLMFDAGMSIPFSRLMNPIGFRSGNKKPVTMLGVINTTNGLEKAIRRHFPRQAANRIIKAQALTGAEYKALMEARKQAIQRRAAKRVKPSGKKIQPR